MKNMLMIGLGFALSASAWADPEAAICADGMCSASSLSAQVLKDVARSDKPVAPNASREELKPTTPPRDAWNRYLHPREDRENFDCILSLGVGAELSNKGFIGTRVLGQTQTWREPGAGSAP
jgi:hypothetical protein